MEWTCPLLCVPDEGSSVTVDHSTKFSLSQLSSLECGCHSIPLDASCLECMQGGRAEQGSRDGSVRELMSLCSRWSASSLPQRNAGSEAGSCLTKLAHLEGSWEEGMQNTKGSFDPLQEGSGEEGRTARQPRISFPTH